MCKIYSESEQSSGIIDIYIFDLNPMTLTWVGWGGGGGGGGGVVPDTVV